MRIRFTEADNRQMKALGIDRAQVLEQIDIFRKIGLLGPPQQTLHPARRRPPKSEIADADNMLDLHGKAAGPGGS